MRKANLIGSGIPPLAATNLTGITSAGLTATGSDQAGALGIVDDISIVTTTAASTGVRLPANSQVADSFVIANHGANALAVYPPTGGKVANGSVNAALSVPATKTVICFSIDGTNFAANLSA